MCLHHTCTVHDMHMNSHSCISMSIFAPTAYLYLYVIAFSQPVSLSLSNTAVSTQSVLVLLAERTASIFQTLRRKWIGFCNFPKTPCFVCPVAVWVTASLLFLIQLLLRALCIREVASLSRDARFLLPETPPSTSMPRLLAHLAGNCQAPQGCGKQASI